MKSAVVVFFPGSNCDKESGDVLKKVGFNVSFVWHKDKLPNDISLCFIPGGFSYGDYLRSGAIAARSEIMNDIKSFAESGGITIGVCNGFQILTEAKILPGALLPNKCGHFVCKTTNLINTGSGGIFSKDMGAKIKAQVAHGDGMFCADKETVKTLIEENRIAFKYEENFNGSIESIAGIIGGKHRNILGMMPHPERTLVSGDFISMFHNLYQRA